MPEIFCSYSDISLVIPCQTKHTMFPMNSKSYEIKTSDQLSPYSIPKIVEPLKKKIIIKKTGRLMLTQIQPV